MGLPHHRLAVAGSSCAVRLDEKTMFNMSEELSDKLMPVFNELKKQAAQSDRITVDDTTVLIQQHISSKARKGTRTSALIAEFVQSSERQNTDHPLTINLFATGSQYAGEFFEEIVSGRLTETPVRYMADAHASNIPKGLNQDCYIHSKCLVHARRGFFKHRRVDQEVSNQVLSIFQKIYAVEKYCQQNQIRSVDRLKIMQERCRIPMIDLWLICYQNLKEKNFEPNDNAIGSAMKYILKHFNQLCSFLKYADCSLDSNIVERLIKKSILHRKNSLFYKTDVGAGVGDVIMSVGFTARAHGVDPHDYFEDLLLNFKKDSNVQNWLPWNWKKTRGSPQQLAQAA